MVKPIRQFRKHLNEASDCTLVQVLAVSQQNSLSKQQSIVKNGEDNETNQERTDTKKVIGHLSKLELCRSPCSFDDGLPNRRRYMWLCIGKTYHDLKPSSKIEMAEI
jgi:hypothetical protein